MQITEIKKIGKGQRYSLFVDEKFEGVFEAEILAKHKLKTGQELQPDFFHQIKVENGDLATFERGLNLLEHGMKTQKQVEDYLRDKGYPQECIERAMQKLGDYGYLNDLAFAKEYVRLYSQKDGEKKLRFSLKNKGVDDETIAQALDECLDEEQQKEVCLNLAKKKLKNCELVSKNKQKLFAYLAGKGYNYDVIKWAIAQIESGEDKNDWN